MAAYCVDMDVEVIDFEVYPIEGEGLDEAKNGFAKKARHCDFCQFRLNAVDC